MKQKIFFERGGIERVGELTSEFQAKRPLVITGGHSYEINGAKEKIEHIHSMRNHKQFVVSTSLPELHEVERGIAFHRNGDFDLIVAIGGGTVLDTAKLVRFLATQHLSVFETIQNVNSITATGVPLVAVPTTAGSGAEATHFAVLYIDKTKYSIAHPKILPNIALVDPELTLTTPPNIAAISGLDALAQGIESYWSTQSTQKSREYARKAIKLAFNSLIPAVCKNDTDARINLSLSALFAGQAINISKTTAPHAISYTLTANYGIPHGHAVALTLGEFLKHAEHTTDDDSNHPLGKNFVLQTIDELCALLRAPNPESACNSLRELLSTLGLSISLSAWGIRDSDFTQIISNVNLERLSNHPRKITEDTIRTVLKNVL